MDNTTVQKFSKDFEEAMNAEIQTLESDRKSCETDSTKSFEEIAIITDTLSGMKKSLEIFREVITKNHE
jgi:hypothetical protein